MTENANANNNGDANNNNASSDDLTPDEEKKFSKYFAKVLADQDAARTQSASASNQSTTGAPRQTPVPAGVSQDSGSLRDLIRQAIQEQDEKKQDKQKILDLEKQVQDLQGKVKPKRWTPFSIFNYGD